MSRDLDRDAVLLADVVNDLGHAVAGATSSDAASLIRARSVVEAAAAALAIVRTDLDNLCGKAMGGYELVVEGVGLVRRHSRNTRKDWDHHGLMHAVLDSVLVDSGTGEILPETEAEKIRAVWGAQKDPAHPLPGYQASVSALKARGIDPADFCVEEEVEGFKLEVKSSDAVAAGLIAKAKS